MQQAPGAPRTDRTSRGTGRWIAKLVWRAVVVLASGSLTIGSIGWPTKEPLQAQEQREQGSEADESRDQPQRSEPEPSDYIELFDPDRQVPEDIEGTNPPEQALDPEFEPPPESELEDAWWVRRRTEIPDRILAPGDTRDPRSVELFHYGCSDRDGRRDLTLFANGTLRQRRGPWQDTELRLEEMGQAELRRHVSQLMRIRADMDFPTQFELDGSVTGAWVGTCSFQLDLPGMETTRLEVSGMAALPLPLQQLVAYAEELAALTKPLVQPENLSPSYEPELGDVLRTSHGTVFRVVGFTSDGQAVELERLDGATIIFVPRDDMSEFFVALENGFRG